MKPVKEFSKDKLKVKVYGTRDCMGKAAAAEAAERIKALLKQKETINIIFAAAPSQNEVLCALTNKADIEWSRVNAFHMDEYIGLEKDATQGFGNFLKERIFDRLNFKQVYYLDGNSANVDEECKRYEKLLKENKPDIVLMGIGENGHIAFNDPHVADFSDPVLVKTVKLDVKCRQQQVNDGCFESLDRVPKQALTLTIPALFSADYAYIVVPAKTKALAVKNTLEGPVDVSCPASIMRNHSSSILYLDLDSASMVELT